MDRGEYIEALTRLAGALGPQRPPGDAERTAYISKLVGLAAKLKTADDAEDDSALTAFRTVLKPNARDIMWRVAGATLERRRSLPSTSRQALHVLEVAPDLLGPLGCARTEVAHSGALAFFLDPTAAGDLGTACLEAFVGLVVAPTTSAEGSDDLPDTLDLTGAKVTAERGLGRHGRVDVSIEAPKALVFIEVKVGASEGPDQLARYGKALDELSGDRDTLLVFLTLDEEATTSTTRAYRHITFRDVLRTWLPIAASSHSEGVAYLSMYLKTIAQHLEQLAGAGEFDRWNLHTQRAALEFIKREFEA